jgi:hypothetical protein
MPARLSTACSRNRELPAKWLPPALERARAAQLDAG